MMLNEGYDCPGVDMVAILQQPTASHCNILQHTATYCNTLQHTATHCNGLRAGNSHDAQ